MTLIRPIDEFSILDPLDRDHVDVDSEHPGSQSQTLRVADNNRAGNAFSFRRRGVRGRSLPVRRRAPSPIVTAISGSGVE